MQERLDPPGGCPVCHLLPVELIVDVELPALLVVMHADKCQWIHRKAEVQAKVEPVERTHLLIRHCRVFHVVEYSAASTGNFAHVFMAISHLILPLELLGILEEALTEPFAWHAEIRRMVDESVRIIRELFLVHPIVL